MVALLAFLLALDQRIELQLPLLVALATMLLLRQGPGSIAPLRKAAVVLAVAALYLLANAAATHVDAVGVADTWWAAPVRVWLFYLLLVAVAAVMDNARFDAENVFRTLEWLFVFKLVIIAFEGFVLLSTGEPRERPLFNVIIATDSLLGVRFTSSYDILFALLALSPRRQVLRLALLAAMLVATETRALMLLSMALLFWRVLQDRSVWALVAGVAVPALLVAGAVVLLNDSAADGESGSRLAQIQGSSLDDKFEQVDAVSQLLPSGHLLIGRGLGVSMPGIVRDEARPYSYEAQTAVLLWQGGVLFFFVHVGILWAYARPPRLVPIAIVLLLGLLNPTLFGLASAFLVLAFGRVIERPSNRVARAHRRRPVHA